MQRAGLVNKGKAAVWLTMKGWDENDKVSYEQT
jgi:hypothetical protein